MQDFPKITDPDFLEEISKKYKRYKIIKPIRSLKKICFPQKFEYQMPQKFLPAYINPDTPYKSILVYHRIGSGKTCTAIQIAEKWKHVRKILFVLPASLKGNLRAELRSKCTGNAYLSDKERDMLKKYHPSSDEYREIIKKSDQRIDEYYNIISYNKFVDYAQQGTLNFKNSLLIVDEIQNMVSEFGLYYNVLYDAIKKAPKELRIVLLSATPIFDKPAEIALTINLLRPLHELPVGRDFDNTFIDVRKRADGTKMYKTKNMDMFRQLVKGYVSYFKGAPAVAFAEEKFHIVRCQMEKFQYKSYKEVLHKEKTEKKTTKKLMEEQDILDLPENFLLSSRVISNLVFPNKKIGEAGYRSLTKEHATPQNLKNYSIKFYKIMKKVRKSEGPVFFYSTFKEYAGVKSFAKILSLNGYKDYRDYGEGPKRYAIFSGDMKQLYKDEIKAVFNQPANINGGKLRLVLGSPAMKEGVSLMNVRQVHILESHWNMSRIMQVVGRAVRTCSHKELPPEKRVVDIYLYLATNEKEKETVDQYIYKLALKKKELMRHFELSLKESAIDCELNIKAQLDEDIKCMK